MKLQKSGTLGSRIKLKNLKNCEQLKKSGSWKIDGAVSENDKDGPSLLFAKWWSW
jgi:hypothetical protein